MNNIFLDPDLLDVPFTQRTAGREYFSQFVLPRAVELEFERILGPLVEKEGLLLLTQIKFPIGDTGRHSIPDLAIVRNRPDLIDFQSDMSALIEFVRKDLKAIFDAKSGLGELNDRQRSLFKWIVSLNPKVDARAINMPIGEVSEDSLVRAMSETIHRASNRVAPDTANKVLRAIVKNLNPNLPVWVAMLSAIVALNSIEEVNEP